MTVIGTDLSSVQPVHKLPNFTYMVHNAEADWDFTSRFDYIHARMLTMGMHDWPRFFRQCWDNLSPGGWLETGDGRFPLEHVEDLTTDRSPFLKWSTLASEAAAEAGIDTRASEKFSDMLTAQGFVNVESIDVLWPVGPWAKGEKNKAIGTLSYQNSRKVIPAVAMALFTNVLGWTKEQVHELDRQCLEEIDRGDHHHYCRMYVLVW